MVFTFYFIVSGTEILYVSYLDKKEKSVKYIQGFNSKHYLTDILATPPQNYFNKNPNGPIFKYIFHFLLKLIT